MILDEIVADKRKRLDEAKAEISEGAMKQLAVACQRESISFYEAMKKPGLSIIGEFKNASPSHGTMADKISLEERIACGIGACLACVCKSKEKDAHSNVHNKRICKDGPVFLSTEVEI